MQLLQLCSKSCKVAIVVLPFISHFTKTNEEMKLKALLYQVCTLSNSSAVVLDLYTQTVMLLYKNRSSIGAVFLFDLASSQNPV